MMKGYLIDVLRGAIAPDVRRNVRRLTRKLFAATLPDQLSETDFRRILQDTLGLRRDCTVLVHSSFGRLKADFSAVDAVQILKSIVGESGNILMPYYPGNGDEWLASGKIFDPTVVPTTTGILAQVFAQSPGVLVSDHPIKAVAAWGGNRDFLIAQHCHSKTPYDELSPYAKLLSLPECRIIGLGTLKMSFYHCCEDSIPSYADTLYTSEAKRGKCRRSDRQLIDVWTRVHRPEVLRSKLSAAQFLAESMCPAYEVLTVKGRSYYTGEARQIYEHVREVLAGDIPPPKRN